MPNPTRQVMIIGFFPIRFKPLLVVMANAGCKLSQYIEGLVAKRPQVMDNFHRHSAARRSNFRAFFMQFFLPIIPCQNASISSDNLTILRHRSTQSITHLMKRPILVSITACMLAWVLLFSGCSKEEILPSPSNVPTSLQALGPSGITLCCGVSGPERLLCEWDAEVERVLNCCYAETPSFLCNWAPLAPIDSASFQYYGLIDDLYNTTEVNQHIQTVVSYANIHRPSADYLFERFTSQNTGIHEWPHQDLKWCKLKSTVYYRKKLCPTP